MILPFSSARIMAMKSLFYTTLITEGAPRVKKWTCKKDLFQTEIILIPINIKDHWSICIVINPIQNQIKYKHQPIKPQIMVLDSLHLHDKMTIANNIRNWLEKE